MTMSSTPSRRVTPPRAPTVTNPAISVNIAAEFAVPSTRVCTCASGLIRRQQHAVADITQINGGAVEIARDLRPGACGADPCVGQVG